MNAKYPAKRYSSQVATPTVAALVASSGGVGALQDFFAATPGDLGLAFMVVIHLSSGLRKGMIPALSAYTPMPVVEVRGSAQLEADHVYVTPNTRVAITGGAIGSFEA